ncbi:MAG: Rieske 2Fe-2S domain-containing protein, partial [Microcoleus sp. SIO2G3]|nr:Rieske 2Fe-2S domain-containing protein [Microcoleus sp. SIO2G3]
QAFNWRHCWYPVTFVQDLPKNRPYSFFLYDEPFVLFRNQEGKLSCLTDRCPHRAAKLSDGQIIDGKIECLYHGWQFDSDGQCLHIPQLQADAKIPVNACSQSFTVLERQGIVWVWPGEPKAASEEDIPTLAALDKSGFVHTDFMLDLPYDQTYFVENVMDPAHVFISHHGTRGGGNRKNAKPLDMEVLESSNTLIRGRWRQTEKPDDVWKHIDFFAPNLVLNTAELKDRDWTFGLALYSIPLGKGRCRLLARGYRNFFTWTAKLRPRWLDHWNTNKILEQDLPLIVGQQEQIERLGQSLKDLYLPLKTSDVFVIEYRKWLDKFGQSLPFYQSYSPSKCAGNNDGCDSEASKERLQSMVRKQQSADRQSALSDRFLRHTQICSSCKRAYQVTNRLKQVSVGVAIALFALAIVTDGSGMQIAAVSASLGAVALAAIAENVKTRFEHSYTRHF